MIQDVSRTHIGSGVRAHHGRAAPAWSAVVASLLVPLFAAGCRESPKKEEPAETPTTVTCPSSATVNDITSNAASYYGKTVVLSGEVTRVINPKTVAIGGEAWSGGELLVVSSDGFPTTMGRPSTSPVAEQDLLQATGTVRRFSASEIQKETGTEMPPATASAYEGKAVLVVKAKDALVTARRAPAAVGAAPGAAADAGAPAAEEAIIDVVTVITAPNKDALVGKHAQLGASKVQKVVATKSVWLGWVGPSGTQQIPMVYDTQGGVKKVNVKAGDTTAVSGTIKKLPSADDMKRNWKLTDAEANALKGQDLYIEIVQIGEAAPAAKPTK